MGPKLYNVLRLGDQNSLRELMEVSGPNLLHQVTTFQKDTVLHVAAKFKSTEIANMIIDKEPWTMYQTNSKGDTPLHIAARLGCQGIVAKMLDSNSSESIEVEANEELVRMVNLEKDTALHEAARSGHSEIVKLLMEKDSELANLANDKGESPLFVAVDTRNFDAAILILELAGPSCSYQGRKNMNALHAAIARLVYDGEMLQISALRGENIFDFFAPESAVRWAVIRVLWRLSWKRMNKDKKIGKTFIVELIEKCPSAVNEADNFGWTPLHHAAHLGYSDIVEMLLQPNNPSTVYSKTNVGMTALHIAAKQGHVSVLQKFRESRPDIWDLEDSGGRTALHVAAESGEVAAVKYILKWASKDLINQKDNDGNTSLHLATIQGHLSVQELLATDTRVDKKAMNKNGLSVLDIIQSRKDLSIRQKLLRSTKYFRPSFGLRSLEQVLHADNTEDQEKAGANYEPKHVQETEESKLSDRVGKIANTNLLVATIIATVSFAAAFSVPGGYKSDGPEEGMATLIKKTSYKAFVLTNALAFFWSMRSIGLQYSASFLVDALELTPLLIKSMKFTGQSRRALFVAFITGSYAALDFSRGLAVPVLVIGLFPYVPFSRNVQEFLTKNTGLLL